MEKLSITTVEYLQKLIKTCALCGIDMVAVEPSLVRGQSLDNSRGTFLLDTTSLPKDLEFTSLGIGRVKVLGTRIAILDEGVPNISFEGKERDNGDVMVRKLHVSNKKTKIEFSCFDSLRIRAPKSFKQTACYEFTISEDTLKVMMKTFAAISTTKISFSNDKDGTVMFRTSDDEGDIFNHSVSDKYEILPEAAKDNFFYEYQIKYILPLLRAAMDSSGNVTIQLTNSGVLIVNVNGFNIYVIAEV